MSQRTAPTPSKAAETLGERIGGMIAGAIG
jgi:hypothetical protein